MNKKRFYSVIYYHFFMLNKEDGEVLLNILKGYLSDIKKIKSHWSDNKYDYDKETCLDERSKLLNEIYDEAKFRKIHRGFCAYIPNFFEHNLKSKLYNNSFIPLLFENELYVNGYYLDKTIEDVFNRNLHDVINRNSYEIKGVIDNIFNRRIFLVEEYVKTIDDVRNRDKIYSYVYTKFLSILNVL